jgi:F420-non-reducing hydrogenase small subunit
VSKLKLGLYWAASCGGCDIAALEIHEKVLDLIEVADIVFWPCVMDFKYRDVEAMEDGHIDVCLFNGAIRNEENRRIAELLRAKSKTLVAYGSCSAFGGIPGLANLKDMKDVFQRMYVESESTDNPDGTLPAPVTEVRPGMELHLPEVHDHLRTLGQVVDVDYTMPGCPPTDKQTWAVIEAIASGNLPPRGSVVGVGDKAVCDECPFEKKDTPVTAFKRPHEVIPDGVTCLLEQGIVCQGPGTRSGCEARCLTANMPCRGCYGPAAGIDDPGGKMIATLGSLVASENEDEILKCVDEIVDPAGTFYRFGLAASLLGRNKS